MAEIPLSINDPTDFVGLGVKNILLYRWDEPNFRKLVGRWRAVVVLEFRHLYSVAVKFDRGRVEITHEVPRSYDLKVTFALQTLVDLAVGQTSPLRAFLTGRVKVAKAWRVGTLARFMRALLPALRAAGRRALELRAKRARGLNFPQAVKAVGGMGALRVGGGR
ncbi:MAG: hypothetical protein Kow0069_18120 [Promethearchaeota archaeon]